MFLLILSPSCSQSIKRGLFTFHNVSINTISGKRNIANTFFHLHSTMFLLILVIISFLCIYINHLHSTMFLLIRRMLSKVSRSLLHLHSTMFLLIPILHNPLYYKPNSTIFCQPCHLLYLSNTIFNNIMKIFLFLQ